MSNTADRIRSLVKESLGAGEVNLDELSSLDKVAVLKKIEGEFGVSILNRDDVQLNSLDDVVNLIDN
ncbi:hypothetical protein [Candidatus Foliamicus sp.]